MITIFLPSFRGGGAEAVMVHLANEFARSGRQVQLLVIEDEGPWKTSLHQAIRIQVLRGLRLRSSFLFLMLYFIRSNPEILISNMSHLNVASVLAKGLSRSSSRLYLVEHNDLPRRLEFAKGNSFRLLVWAMAKTYPYASQIICVSEGVKGGVLQMLGVPETLVSVIPNGIDASEIELFAHEKVDHPWLRVPGPPVLVSVGRLVEQKGFDVLLKAMNYVLQSYEARLILLGGGPQKEALEDLTKSLSIDHAVEFQGFVENPYAYIKQSSLYVLSSRYEGFGIVILEALALGVPVVSTDCPSGPGELLDHGRYGVLVPPDQPELLGEAILALLRDQSKQEHFSQLGPTRVKEFEIGDIAQKYLELLDQTAPA